MRHVTKIWDFYRVHLEDGTIRYFQFLGKDSSDLSGDVIRIFKRHYMLKERPSIQDLANDEIECYMHSSVSAGVKLGYWELYSRSKEPVVTNIYFKSSLDIGLTPCQKMVSYRWWVWKMNGPRIYYTKLPDKYWAIDLGGVYAPSHVIDRLKTGKDPDIYYPIPGI